MFLIAEVGHHAQLQSQNLLQDLKLLLLLYAVADILMKATIGGYECGRMSLYSEVGQI